MKIFHIITHFDLGGAERVAINIARSKSEGFEYHLVEVVRSNSDFSKELISEIQRDGIIIHRSLFTHSKIAIIFFPIWFTFVFLKWRPKIIHTHTEIPDLSVFVWNKIIGHFFKGIKYVRTIHNTILWTSWTRIGRIVEHFFIKKKANVAISSSTGDFYESVYGQHTPIIYNGLVEVEQKTFNKIEKSRYNILFAGRLEHQKGVDELCEVVRALSSNKRIVFHIVGDGSLYEKIAQMRSLSNVRIYDKIYGLAHYIGSFDYLFMPSNHEGLGLISVEASLAKTPSIINSCPGLNETLPEDWPLKVDNNSVSQFVKIFNSLPLLDRKELGEKAHLYVKDLFSIKKMQSSYELFYQPQKNL